MATFTTWTDLRTALKNALMTLASGSPFTENYTINGRTHTVRNVDDIKAMIAMTYEIEALENSGTDTEAYYEVGAY